MVALDTHQLSPKRTVLGLATLFGGVALGAGAIIGVAAGVGAVWHATNPSSGASASVPGAVAQAPSAVKLTIKSVNTPAGSEPAYVGPSGIVGSPVLFEAKAGVKTTVTIVNDDDQPHTFTSSGLGVNVSVPPGPSTVHFTIDPSKPGLVSWQCDVPCGAWVMSHAGYMEGQVKVS
jgi:hypothetical protein